MKAPSQSIIEVIESEKQEALLIEDKHKAGLDSLPQAISHEETIRLFRILQDESVDLEKREKAREILINSNLRLVKRWVEKLSHNLAANCLEEDDLFQEGVEGLMTAVEKFNPDHEVELESGEVRKNIHFSTYASWWIRQGIFREINNRANTIRIPVHMNEKLSKIFKVSSELTQELGREPTLNELSDVIGIKVSKIREILKVGNMRKILLLEFPRSPNDDGPPLSETTAITDGGVEKIAETSLCQQAIAEAFSLCGLTKREQDVLNLRSDVIDEKKWTLDKIGKKYGIGRERVRQIQTNALKKLRKNKKLRQFWEESFIE